MDEQGIGDDDGMMIRLVVDRCRLAGFDQSQRINQHGSGLTVT